MTKQEFKELTKLITSGHREIKHLKRLISRTKTDLEKQITDTRSELQEQILNVARNQVEMRNDMFDMEHRLRHDISQEINEVVRQAVSRSQTEIIAVIHDVMHISDTRFTKVESRVTKLERA